MSNIGLFEFFTMKVWLLNLKVVYLQQISIMKIKIDSVDTNWTFVGSSMDSTIPSFDDFDIEKEQYQKYIELEEKKEKLNKWMDKGLFSTVCGAILSLVFWESLFLLGNQDILMKVLSGIISAPFLAFLTYPIAKIPFYLLLDCPIYLIRDYWVNKKLKSFNPSFIDSVKQYNHALYQFKNNDSNLYKIINDSVSSFMLFLKGVIFKVNKEQREEWLRQSSNWWFSLTGYQFEEEVARWFRNKGFSVKLTPKSGDGGVDVILTDVNGNKTYVQCKHYTNKQVDAPTLRELYGVAMADKVQCAIACLHGLTTAAKEFASKVNMKVYTLNDFLNTEKTTSDGQLTIFDDEQEPIVPNLETMSEEFSIGEDGNLVIGDILVRPKLFYSKQLATSELQKDEWKVVQYNNFFFILNCSEIRMKQIEVGIMSQNRYQKGRGVYKHST